MEGYCKVDNVVKLFQKPSGYGADFYTRWINKYQWKL